MSKQLNEDDIKAIVSLPQTLNFLMEETINTQAYIKALSLFTIPKEKITEFDAEVEKQREHLRSVFLSKNK
jgi:hypothetical protein